MLCSGCGPNKCQEYPGTIQVACPACNEIGCESCGGDGYFEIKECPHKEHINSETKQLITECDFAKMGTMPDEGGLNNQKQLFVDSCLFYFNEQSRVESESYKKL